MLVKLLLAFIHEALQVHHGLKGHGVLRPIPGGKKLGNVEQEYLRLEALGHRFHEGSCFVILLRKIDGKENSRESDHGCRPKLNLQVGIQHDEW